MLSSTSMGLLSSSLVRSTIGTHVTLWRPPSMGGGGLPAQLRAGGAGQHGGGAFLGRGSVMGDVACGLVRLL